MMTRAKFLKIRAEAQRRIAARNAATKKVVESLESMITTPFTLAELSDKRIVG